MSVLKMVVIAAVVFAMAACGPGETGPAGPQGTPGSGLTKIVSCTGFADSDGDKLGWNLVHEVYTFSDGSVLATCEVKGGNLSSSSVLMHRANTPGARAGGCIATRDDETDATSGIWIFALGSVGVASNAKYADPGSPTHGRVFALSCASE